MASKYWIKLYHEILSDPKMGLLPDQEWRRCIELFLLAGQVDEGGQLPGTDDIAWHLHIDAEQLQGEFDHLQEVGIIKENGDGWYIPKFAERQAPVSDAERQQRYRKRKVTSLSRDNNDSVTNSVTNSHLDTDTDIDTDKDVTKRAKKRAPPTPAFQIFTGITDYYKITKYWRTKMADVVGEERSDLELWAKVIKAWTGKGWFAGNVKGMLEFYTRGEIPGSDKADDKQKPTSNKVRKGVLAGSRLPPSSD